MQIKAFTLLELLIVIFIIGIISFLSITLPSFNKIKYTVLDLKKLTYPNGKFYLFADGSNLLITNDKNKSINIDINLPEVLVYENEIFSKKTFEDFNNKKVIFKYIQENGIGDVFILKTDEGIYVFKPFLIKKFNSLKKAKDYFLLKKYQPTEGNYF